MSVPAVIAIDAPHFYAGIVEQDSIIIEAAPIVKYMRGWRWEQVVAYCRRKGWTLITDESSDTIDP